MKRLVTGDESRVDDILHFLDSTWPDARIVLDFKTPCGSSRIWRRRFPRLAGGISPPVWGGMAAASALPASRFVTGAVFRPFARKKVSHPNKKPRLPMIGEAGLWLLPEQAVTESRRPGAGWRPLRRSSSGRACCSGGKDCRPHRAFPRAPSSRRPAIRPRRRRNLRRDG